MLRHSLWHKRESPVWTQNGSQETYFPPDESAWESRGVVRLRRGSGSVEPLP